MTEVERGASGFRGVGRMGAYDEDKFSAIHLTYAKVVPLPPPPQEKNY
jgi:hypothetical protein